MGSWFGCFNGYGYGNGFGIGGYVMMFLGLVVIGLIIYFLVKGQNQNQNRPQTYDALEIAKARLAKGEITPEEYENIKKNLL